MSGHAFLAFDIGAESGRASLGTLVDGRVSVEEIHRFPNGAVTIHGTMYWDILGIHRNVLDGLRAGAQAQGAELDGVGIDTWGLDFGLLGPDGRLLANPVCYRDSRTQGMLAAVLERLSAAELYDETGVALVPLYTLYQMLALRLHQPVLLDGARCFLMMPDLMNYFLTGEKRGERSNAISTQLYNPRTRDWSESLFRIFDLPRAIMPPLADPGTCLGELSNEVKTEVGLRRAPLVAPCTHDTPSAVAAVPGEGAGWAFISSGTWSTVGALAPGVTRASEVDVYSVLNEVTIGSFFLCRNIMGLWLLQQARAAWRRTGQELGYDELVQLAEAAPGQGPLVHTDHPLFLAPDDMGGAIDEFCRMTGQESPRGPGAVARCILESLALSHRQAVSDIAANLGRTFEVVHIVGGGSRNRLLCQLTANATGLPVLAGPVEATILGNVLAQAMGRGLLGSAADIRAVVRRSTQLTEYLPRESGAWAERIARYRSVLDRSKRSASA